MPLTNLTDSLITSLKQGLAYLARFFSPSSHALSRASIASMPEAILLTYLTALEAGRQPDGWTDFPYSKEELAQLIRYKALGQAFRK